MTLVVIGLIGIAGGFLAGLFGVGGGILFVPSLALVLGLTQLHAEASSLLAILPTALVGSWRQHRYGNVAVRAAAIIGIASIAGVQGGVVLAETLPESALRRLFGVLLLATAGQIAWRAWRRSATLPDVSGPEDIWIPLVDEPIGSIVEEIQESHPEIDELVVGAHRALAFRTFAYIRVGMLLGELLVDTDVPAGSDDSWVEALLREPANYEAVVREVRAVAEEIATDTRYAAEEPVGPDDAARQRFREFARKQLGS